MKKNIYVLLLFCTFQFDLNGQILDTICEGIDGNGACCIIENFPDTVWLETSVPVKIDFLVNITYDKHKANKNGIVNAHVKRMDAMWATAFIDNTNDEYMFNYFSPPDWTLFYHRKDTMKFKQVIDTPELKQIIDTTYNLIYHKFVGCECNIVKCRWYSNRKKTFVRIMYHKNPVFTYNLIIYILPKNEKY